MPWMEVCFTGNGSMIKTGGSAVVILVFFFFFSKIQKIVVFEYVASALSIVSIGGRCPSTASALPGPCLGLGFWGFWRGKNDDVPIEYALVAEGSEMTAEEPRPQSVCRDSLWQRFPNTIIGGRVSRNRFTSITKYPEISFSCVWRTATSRPGSASRSSTTSRPGSWSGAATVSRRCSENGWCVAGLCLPQHTAKH